jgi:hypothetical protein
MFLGDPITGQGWLDSNPADRRMMLSVGPFTLAPGASATFTFALIVARGGDRLSSIQRVQCAAIEARNAFNQDYQRPFPVLGPECTTVASCPAPASAWAALCADPSGLPPLALSTLAAGVFNRTRSFIPAIPYEDSFCAAVSDADPTIPRARAQREHLAFLANLVAPFVGGFVSGDQAIGLDSKTPVSCPWSAATTAGQLGEVAPQDLPLEATYFSVDDDPRDLQSVDFGLEAYGGGVGFGSSFFASSIDPFTHPDSFVTVELRFDAASTQKAYRYLRLTLDDGFSVPPGGREYRYAGYHTVPVEAIDVATGDRLELAFVEKAYVDAAGTMLPPGQQPATFDSTWLPSIASDGDREYLFVIRRGDTGSPRPDMEVDDVLGGITSTTAVPVLYAMALRRIAADEYPDPGEKLVITPFSAAPSEGVDARMLALAGQKQDDPATLAAYNEIADCLAVINAGIGPGCDITTPTTIAIEESSVEGGVVHLAWYVAGEGAGPYDLARRRNDAEAWTPLARLAVDGTRRVRYEDRNVAAGERWSYGLFDPRDPAHPLDVVDITLPGTPEFALRIGVGRGGRLPTLAFSLPTAGEARLEMFDASGRRRFGGSLGTLDAGPHVQAWPAGAPTDAGLLFVRLTFAGKSVLGRAVVLR